MTLAAWLAGVLVLLAAVDPVGAWLVSRYPSSITLVSPLPVYRGSLAEVEFATRRVWLDPEAVRLMGRSEPERETIAACALAHEAAHLRYPVAAHDVAYLYQYVCLDRARAGWDLKERVYERIMEAVIVPPMERGE